MIKTRKYRLSYTRKKWYKRDTRELLESCETLHDIVSLREKLLFEKLQIKDDFLNRKISFNQFNKRTNKIDFKVSNLGSNLISCFIEQALESLHFQNSDSSNYRYLARFIITPKNISRIKGYDLLQEIGYYNKDTNPNGVVKDHRFSIHDGKRLGINPKLLGNINNCEFLRFQDNLRKSKQSSITLEEFKNLPVSG